MPAYCNNIDKQFFSVLFVNKYILNNVLLYFVVSICSLVSISLLGIASNLRFDKKIKLRGWGKG